MDVLTLLVLGICELWLDLEGVGTEVITLGLEEVGRKILGAVTIEPRERSRESGSGDTEKSRLGDNITPSRLGLVDGLVEEVAEEKVLKIRVGAVRRCDILEEDGADNAATTPHEGDGWLVKLPSVFLSSLVYLLVQCHK